MNNLIFAPRFVSMRPILLVVFLFFSSLLASADIAETQELQRKREKIEEVNELILHNRTLGQLTAAELKQYNANLDSILKLDKAIIASQEETIKRVASYAGAEHAGKSKIVAYAFLLSFVTFLSLYFAYLMNRKVNKLNGTQINYLKTLKEFLAGTFMVVSPPKGMDRSAAVTNLLIMFALGFMFISFIAYLMKIV